MNESCGPSSALSSLKSQVDRDRTLHQTQAQRTSSQAFRNIDAETSRRANEDYQRFLSGSRDEATYRGHLVEAQRREGKSDWMNDFQKHSMQSGIHHTAQNIQHDGRHAQGQVQGWGSEFMAMQKQPIHTPYMPMMPMMSMNQGIQFPMTMESQSSRHLEISDQRFNEAFEDAERSLTSITLDNAPDLAYSPHLDIPDSSTEETTKAETDKAIEASALSNIAGNLIYSLKDEKSDKFKNSQFMALMHKLHEKEVVVEGDAMINAVDGSKIDTHL